MRPSGQLRIGLRTSRALAAALVLAHMLAATAIILSELPNGMRAVLLLAVGASLAWTRRPADSAALVLHADGRIEQVGADGTAMEFRLEPQTVVMPGVVVLVSCGEAGRSALVLPADAMTPDEARQLRVWLRWR